MCKKYSCNLIQASSATVYNSDDNPHIENSRTGPIDICGYSKKVNEDTLKFFFDPKDGNLFGVNIRFFNIYGPRDGHPHVISEIINQIKTQFDKNIITLELDNMELKKDFIYTGDIVDAMIEVEDKIKNGIHIFNMCSGNS